MYRARDRRAGFLVAIKFLQREYVANAVEVLARELRLAAMIKHPNVVAPLEVGVSDEAAFIVTEYVEGESLEALMHRQRRLPISVVARIGEQIADGLAAIHEAGVVHRDLKPSNILLNTEGFVKIIDFGLATTISDDDAATTQRLAIGTPMYMSPEQASGNRDITPASDQFSLGVILYEALTGDVPFQGPRIVDALLSKINDEPAHITDIRSDVPVALADLVGQLLAKQPYMRATAVQSALALHSVVASTAQQRSYEEDLRAALDQLGYDFAVAIGESSKYRELLSNYGEWASSFCRQSAQEVV